MKITRQSMFRMAIIMAAVWFCLFCAPWTQAQETADIVGTVTDATGAVVPGAHVTLTNTGTNISQSAQTGSDGNYTFPLLQVGTYVVKVEATGFQTFVAPSIPLSAGDRVRVDAKMIVGSQTTTVEVQAAAPALQTDTSNVSVLVPSQQVEDLPLNGRNIITLVTRTAGANEGSPGSIVAGNRPDDRRQNSQISVNGQQDTQNNNLIDGMDNNERFIGSIGVRPSVDAIQEVNVQTNNYDASVGRTGGAVIDIITKSGTNDLHGTVYEFFRNKVLNANPNYNFAQALNPGSKSPAAPNPAFRQNQYGGTLGGPIKKNKTFFFGDYEGLRYATGKSAALFNVPTYCERGLGNSSSPFAKPCPDGGTAPGDFSDIKLVSSPGGSTTQPNTPGPNLSGLPLCTGSSAPGTCLSPLGLAYFNMYPLPNTGAAGAILQNYTSTTENTQNSQTWDVKVDQHFSDKNTMYLRYTHNGESTLIGNGFPAVTINPATGAAVSAGTSGGVLINPTVTTFSGTNSEAQDQGSGGFVHIFNSNLVLNLKFSIFQNSIYSYTPNQGKPIMNELGFPCNATACIGSPSALLGRPNPNFIIMSASISGANGAGGYTTIQDLSAIPLEEWDTDFHYFGGLTWTKNAHSVRFGASLIRRRAAIDQASTPSMSFTGAYTGVAPGDLIEGLDVSLNHPVALVKQQFRMWEPSVYVQDDWRFRRWLTLNLGVRYDIFTPFTEANGQISNYNPYIGLLVSPSLPGPQHSSPTANVPTRYNALAPRIGFAATLAHNTVIRGGFGLSFFPVNYESPYYEKNAPFSFRGSCQAQNEVGTNVSCATAQFGSGAVGQFSNGLTVTYGLPTSNPGSNVGKTGGALMAAGLPSPYFDVTLATNPANYAGTGIQAIQTTDFKQVYLEQFNLAIQKQFGANVVSVGYVGQIGRHIEAFDTGENQNLAANPTENITGLPLTVGGMSNEGFGVLQGYPYLKTVSVSEPAQIGTSFYNGLQSSFQRRFNHGLTVNFSYVWSHMLDNIAGNRACVVSMFATPEPCWYDLSNGAGPSLASATSPGACGAEPTVCHATWGWQKADWGNDSMNVFDRFTWGLNYQLPFGKSDTGVKAGFIKGWSTNFSGSWQTGIPFSVTDSVSNSQIAGSQYPDQICSGKLANPTIQHWFNYNCFVQPVAGTEGDMHPGQFKGPSLTRFDASLFKDFALTERVKMQFRTEIFNLFNTPNFNGPSGTSIAFKNGAVDLTGSHATTGQISSMNAAWNPRQIQFALKFLF